MSAQRVRVYARARAGRRAGDVGTETRTSGGGEADRRSGGALTEPADGEGGAWIDGAAVRVRTTASTHGIARRYAVDGAFDGNATQREVYAECCAPVLEAVRNGCRGCVLAYGQTGSGKTYSLLNGGVEDEGEGASGGPGIIPRIAVDCFARAASDARHAYEVSVSMAQIYNEHVDDLVAKRSGLKVTPACDGSGWEIEGLAWTPCRNAEDVLECFRRGRSRLVYAETHMNKQSSRSHCVFQMQIERIERPLEAETDEEAGTTDGETSDAHKLVTVEKRCGLLTIVDLAGSERQKKTQNVGERFKEALNINASLFALGNVVSALAAGHKHIPYRDSTLTKILESSLNGKSRTVMLVCVNTEVEHANESASSLDFATRAMRIVTSPEVRSSVVDMDPRKLTQALRGQCDDEAVDRLMGEVTSLRRALANATKSSEEDINAMKHARDQLQHEICNTRVQTESLKKALELARCETMTKAKEFDAIESLRSSLEARVRGLLVKVATMTSERESERARCKNEVDTMRAAARKLEAQLSAERATATHNSRRAEQLSRAFNELKSTSAIVTKERTELYEEISKLRSTSQSQRVVNARLTRAGYALESKLTKFSDENEELACELFTTYVLGKYHALRYDAVGAQWRENTVELSRRFIEADAARSRHSVFRRAAARRSTERSALLDSLRKDNASCKDRLRKTLDEAGTNDARYTRDVESIRAKAESHARRARVAAHLHAVSTDRQLERGIVLTKIARNGKFYERCFRINAFSGALESAPLPRRFRVVAQRPPRAADVSTSPNDVLARDDDRGIVSVPLFHRSLDLALTHGADLTWAIALARRFAHPAMGM
ncbi:P-loop containing nucleoside triphosphate hydrolase [Ostreococcus tauri]|uniref:P-loop containing nucleoside triphosphate hydrolase n=1 Tax=Ostreococcus tauri TaxID=70448 RepID=A0A090M3G6_OSTTA|nr:P-loop containing nucleoside triphosphate hydrolase [Ostreococcus tauri]CEF98775.1 P-loop containing nucleoside triphosphate hydrolase [Ostreococcus tauri]|eukprot:XP_003080401.2 P-loop containing nucleoside triphosphate hydrolase [Ostreococcus tauri]